MGKSRLGKNHRTLAMTLALLSLTLTYPLVLLMVMGLAER